MKRKIIIPEDAKKNWSFILGRVKSEYNTDLPIQAANKFGDALHKDFSRLGDDGVFDEAVEISGEQFKIIAHRMGYDIEILTGSNS